MDHSSPFLDWPDPCWAKFPSSEIIIVESCATGSRPDYFSIDPSTSAKVRSTYVDVRLIQVGALRKELTLEHEVRLSHEGLQLLRLMMEQPQEKVAGIDVARKLKIGSGTLYPLLARLAWAGWLSSGLEEIDPSVENRPQRRLYKLTPLGQSNAKRSLDELYI